jgi:pyrimidine operon attenuation protein/uracil phosphoribosyltransferase
LILGVRGAGSQLARRLAKEVAHQANHSPEVGEIEIYGSGDELKRLSPDDREAGPLNLKGREVILVDDVIFTGRTVKSALSILFRSARPQSVRLAVLVDRGHREVPVKPNYVGKHIPSSESDRVRVKLSELEPGERDQVIIYAIMNPSEEPRRAARNSEFVVK